MKKFLYTLLLLLLLPTPATQAFGYEVGGIDYYIDAEEFEAVGTDYYGDSIYKITKAYAGAYIENEGLTGSVVIPSSITYSYEIEVRTGIEYEYDDEGYIIDWDYIYKTFSYSINCPVVNVYCSGALVTSITVPDSVNRVSLNDCPNLTSVSLPSSLQSLSFRDCPCLKSITIPEAVTNLSCYGTTRLNSLVWNARNCPSNGNMYTQDIEQVTIGEQVEVLPSGFARESKITSVVVPNSVTTIGANAFYGCTDLESVTLGTGIKNIGNYMFHECHALSQISIPNSVTRIGDYAFNYCDGLGEITIPSSVKNIGEGAFYWCTGLKNLVIPEGVDTIGKRAFYYCRELRSVDLPSTLTFIGAYAFFSDEHLGDVTCRATVPPRIENVNCFYPAYDQGYADATLHVPASSVTEYKNARYWSYFNHVNPIYVTIAGDVDADGRVSIADVTELIDLLLNASPGMSDNSAADVDGDGRISIADVTELIDRLLNGN